MQAPLIDWADPPRELVGFIGQFLAAGAIGFRYFALGQNGHSPIARFTRTLPDERRSLGSLVWSLVSS